MKNTYYTSTQTKSTGAALRVDFQARNIAGGKEKHFTVNDDRLIWRDVRKLSSDELNNI